MILADTSVWISHLRSGVPALAELLEDALVLVHPMVIGELAVGSLGARREILSLLGNLPSPAIAQHHEVLTFVEDRRLHGRGLGWVGVHLLASTLISTEARLWTEDRRLATAAHELGIGWAPSASTKPRPPHG